MRSRSVIKMSAVFKVSRGSDVSVLRSVLIYIYSVVLYRCPLGEDSQIEPGMVCAAFCVGESVGAFLLGDAGEEGCGVSV